MNIPKCAFRCFTAISAGITLLLFSGCITLSENTLANSVAYTPVASPVQIKASATVEASDSLAPEQRAIWKKWMNNDQTIANYLNVLARAVRNDLSTCGLFTRIVTDPSAKTDYHVNIVCYESHPSDFRFKITITATDSATGQQVSSRTREHSLGSSMFDVKIQEKLPSMMAQAKADLAADLMAIVQGQQAQAERAETELLTKATFAELLASSDKNEPLARARNRALVAAKNQQIPAILRESKTDELTSLVVKIEQTILDLNHECEVAKDQAQQSVVDGSSENARQSRGGRGDASQTTAPTQFEETRGLAICYRERIELLKPILVALKEEIANRNR
jgi:hypothetical protein